MNTYSVKTYVNIYSPITVKMAQQLPNLATAAEFTHCVYLTIG